MRKPFLIALGIAIVLLIGGSAAFVLLRGSPKEDAASAGFSVAAAFPSASLPRDGFVIDSIEGTGFEPGMFVSIARVGQQPIAGSGGTAESVTRLSDVGLDLARAVPGAWDIVLTRADGSRASCAGCFTVLGQGGDVSVSSVAPSSGRPGSEAELTVTGSGFQEGAVAAFSGSGVSARETRFVSSTTLALKVVIAGNAAPGSRGLTVANPDISSGSCAGCFTVGAGAPAPVSASPAALSQGVQRQQIAIAGSGFQSGASVSFSGTGIAVSSTTVTGPAEITATVSVSAGAAPGARTLSVKNPDGQQGSCDGCFTVGAGASIQGLEPGTLVVGMETQVTIRGSGFQSGATVSFSGTGITVASTTVTGPAEITATVSVSAGAAPGARALSVKNPDSAAVTKAGIPVTLAPPAASSIAPSAVAASTTTAFVITGSGFQSGASVSFSGTGIAEVSTRVVSPARIETTIDLASSAAPGRRNVTVTNPDLQASTCTGCLTVTAP